MKKIFAALVSASILSISSPYSMPLTTEAATEIITLGDANGDGTFNLADSRYITDYLVGLVAPTASQVTAMDINQDYVVDIIDAYIIQYMCVHNISTTTVNKELYTLPLNEERDYIKYDCATAETNEYTLSPIQTSNQSTFSNDYQTDNLNENVVLLSSANGDYGSGFIIDDHVIATAAHCVYGDNGFLPYINVKIYNSGTSSSGTPDMVCSALSYHIPKDYLTLLNNRDKQMDNYDYALIYVDEDLSDYAPFYIGICTEEFSLHNDIVSVSGFTPGYGGWGRYLSQGNVKNIADYIVHPETHNLPQHRLAFSAPAPGGESGGLIYHTSSYRSYQIKSAVAVYTGGGTINGEIRAWGVKLTPTLINFYKRNINIYN